jgi:hypothetical protein
VHAGIAHLAARLRKLLGVFDSELDSIDCDAGLIRDFKFNWRRPQLDAGFDQLDDSAHGF